MPTDLFLACQLIFFTAKACSCSPIQHVRFILSTCGLGLDFASSGGLDFTSAQGLDFMLTRPLVPIVSSNIVRLFLLLVFFTHFFDQSPPRRFSLFNKFYGSCMNSTLSMNWCHWTVVLALSWTCRILHSYSTGRPRLRGVFLLNPTCHHSIKKSWIGHREPRRELPLHHCPISCR